MAKAPKWGQVLWIHRKKRWEKTAPACPIISASRKIFFFFTRRTRKLLPSISSVSPCLVKMNSYRFGCHQSDFLAKRIFLNTNESCFSGHSLWGTAGGNYYRPDWVSKVTEPTERCHQQGTCNEPSWWKELISHSWVREQLGLWIYYSQVFFSHY